MHLAVKGVESATHIASGAQRSVEQNVCVLIGFLRRSGEGRGQNGRIPAGAGGQD